MLRGYAQPHYIASILGYALDDERAMADVALGIEIAEEAVDDYTQTQFDWEPDASKVFDGSGSGMLTLGFFLKSLKGVWVLGLDRGRYVERVGVVAEPTPLRKNRRHTWLQGDHMAFPRGLANIEVFGDWGYEPSEMPRGVQTAVAYAVKQMFDLRMFSDLTDMESGLGRMTTSVKRWSKIYQLPEVSRNILDYWKNRRWMTE